MDTMTPDEKPPQLTSHSAPAPPGVLRLPPSEGSHGLAPPRVSYDPGWRSYHSYEGANTDQRGPPPPHAVAGPHPYTGPSRDSQHPSHDSSFGRPGSISGPSGSPTEPHPPHVNYRPINGSSHDPNLHPSSGEFRPRLGYPPNESQPNGEAPHAMPVLTHPDAMQPPAGSHPHGQYPSSATPVAHNPAQYDANSYFLSQAAGALGPRQRRTTRAQQACDQCRARKAKCDEGRPACSHCKESNVQCVYKDVPPHKHERATQLLLERLQQIDDQLDKLHQIDDLIRLQSDQNIKLDNLLAQKGVRRTSHPSMVKSDVKSVTSHVSPQEALELSEQRKGPKDPESAMPKVESGDRSYRDVKGEAVDLDDGGLSIPIEHTTAAHKLLLWPSIQKLLPEKIDDDYVMELEEARGPIRPYGRGEGDDRSDSSRHPGSPMTNSPSSRDDEETLLQSPSPGTVWGTGFGFYPGTDGSKVSVDRQVGGLNALGTLNTDSDIVQLHLQSYLLNMHILHPFLEQKSLKSMVATFVRNYSARKKSFVSQFAPTSAGDPTATLQRVPKRKRSADAPFGGAAEVESSQSPTYNMGMAPIPLIQRSIDNAIVLLVLALGAICAWKKDIPGPIPDPVQRHFNSTFGHQSGLSPDLSDSGMQTSPTFQSPTDSSYLPLTGEKRRRHSGMSHPGGAWNLHDAPAQLPRNMDVIPGMAYYAYASDILGNLQGGNDLPHAQACLLAALYAGQLAHPFASHGWISQASRACQVLVRPRKYDTLPEGSRKDLINFAFWTCLQLESDILAELDLPASGISRWESRIDFPKGVFAHSIPNEIHAPSTMMMLYYSAQIHLRKVLNRVHTDLYKADKKERKTTWSTKVQEALSYNLEQWRSGLPTVMKWKDGDALPKDINIARMRAKYYGARYIIHRPLLHHALHPILPKTSNTAPAASPAPSGVSSSQSQVSPSLGHIQHADSMERWSSDMGPPGRGLSISEQPPTTLKELEPKVLEACMFCIDAAYHSTVAFDGVEGRPVITNIFGTAHAQFGNMLVLAATYTSHLSQLVDRDRLRTLLDRTIEFLLQSRHISPTLCKDAEILTMIRRKIFERPTASFSSNDG